MSNSRNMENQIGLYPYTQKATKRMTPGSKDMDAHAEVKKPDTKEFTHPWVKGIRKVIAWSWR